MTPGQANYFLAHFPVLTREVRNRRDDIINQCRQEAFAGGTRGSGHSDPTANKAILLADGSVLEDILCGVRAWIDADLPPQDRPLLIAVWRSRNYGWFYVSRELKREVRRCQARWSILTSHLAVHLNQYAGTASAAPGAACVTGQKKTYPE